MEWNYYRQERRWFFCLLRLTLAGIYFAAAIPKIYQTGLFKATLLAYYSFFPDIIATGLAIAIPWVEFGLGLLLLQEKRPDIAAGLLMIMSGFYVINALVFLKKWMPYGCGCFGFGEAEVLNIAGVIRNSIIAVISVVVYWSVKSGKARWRRTGAG
ncbi:MAG: hypothetical protein FWG61_07670 [Firmicutes bacterium]|nr:hypothetical protein [Bacillota bacterium]